MMAENPRHSLGKHSAATNFRAPEPDDVERPQGERAFLGRLSIAIVRGFRSEARHREQL